MKRTVHAAAFALASLSLCSGAGAEIVTIEIPGATLIEPAGINDKGQVTGYYVDTHGCHGFIWQQDGTLVTFDVPNALLTQPVAIGPTGVIVGKFDKHLSRGFVRAADGTITTFKVPNSRNTVPTGANRKSWSVGFRYTDLQNPDSQPFLRSPSGATTEFSLPGATPVYQPLVVNRSRTIAGNTVVQGVHRGFIRAADGAITLIQNPDGYTAVGGINDAATVSGSLYADGSYQGFVRTGDGTLTAFAFPNGTTSAAPLSINNSGVVAGFFQDSDRVHHGFLRTAGGTFTTYDFEGAVNTDIIAINNKGMIVGVYTDKDNKLFAFAGKP